MNDKDHHEVRIRQLPHGENLPLPAYSSAYAAGLDLVAAVPTDTRCVIESGEYALIPTGIVIALPPGMERNIRTRSGLAAKHGVIVLNATIDSDYRGEVSVILANLGRTPFELKRGERVAYLVVSPVIRVGLREVAYDDL
jgi:dUTP pyrophosphatase